MRLTRSSLCNLLLAEGDEDLAVLLAHADHLPDPLDSDRDGEALAALGLDGETLAALLPAVSGTDAGTGTGTLAPAEMARLEQTISDRWAHLVDNWVRASDS